MTTIELPDFMIVTAWAERPIADAPRDGSYIHVLLTNDDVIPVRWVDVSEPGWVTGNGMPCASEEIVSWAVEVQVPDEGGVLTVPGDTPSATDLSFTVPGDTPSATDLSFTEDTARSFLADCAHIFKEDGMSNTEICSVFSFITETYRKKIFAPDGEI